MIRSVKFSNFYSFEGTHEINFVAKKKKTYDYSSSLADDQITKIAGFIGGNASGKTNIMRLFSFLGYFVGRSVKDDPHQVTNVPFKTFFNNNLPSSFLVEFEQKEEIYYYDFQIKNNIILKETLYIKKSPKSTVKVCLFKRERDKVKYLNNKYFSNLLVDSFPNIREDVSFITFFKKSAYNVDVINEVYAYFSEFVTNINERGDINNFGHQFNSLEVYIEDKDIKKEMEDFIFNFDLGLIGFDIKKEVKEEGIKITVNGLHKVGVKSVSLDFSYESRGTRALFFAMANILNAIKNNRVVIIDEIEAGFHPEALNKLIAYFIDNNKNKKAQLLFSSHALGFMDRLDMHQIYLVNKDNKSNSGVCRLNKIKGIRPDENFMAKYMTGVYGAFPKIRV
ncbi:MAG: hypothetical protein ACD_22C00040G0002 [uncultured bacterium]|nr:MAG: hypothetical protein ACD_22C00040G0002 [uncultured bacterium]